MVSNAKIERNSNPGVVVRVGTEEVGVVDEDMVDVVVVVELFELDGGGGLFIEFWLIIV